MDLQLEMIIILHYVWFNKQYQKNKKNKKRVKVGSMLNGRSKVMDAGNICRDNVLNRLIIFHWKGWTYLSVRHLFIMSSLSKKLEQIQVGNEVEDVNMEVDHTENMPPSNMKRWDLSDFFKTICLYQ